jgi:ABC-type glycerol-3-phosphate transport system permease component
MASAKSSVRAQTNASPSVSGHRSRWQPVARSILFNAVLLFGAFLSAFPFYWMFVLSTQDTQQIFSWPPQFTPGNNLLTNYQNIFAIIPFWRNFANSAFVGITHTVLALLFCSMGGYAFAMYRFPGRNWLFALLLATMMIPWMAGIVPWFNPNQQVVTLDQPL